jgi:hypothetical protein
VKSSIFLLKMLSSRIVGLMRGQQDNTFGHCGRGNEGVFIPFFIVSDLWSPIIDDVSTVTQKQSENRFKILFLSLIYKWTISNRIYELTVDICH